MNHRNRSITDNQDTDLAFHNARQKAHVYEHAVVPLQIVLTLRHEFRQRVGFCMVIHRLSTGDLGIARHRLPRPRSRRFVGKLDTPNALPGRAAVLLKHPLAAS